MSAYDPGVDIVRERMSEGAQAFREGKRLGDNPFRRAMGAYAQWRLGYLEAKRLAK